MPTFLTHRNCEVTNTVSLVTLVTQQVITNTNRRAQLGFTLGFRQPSSLPPGVPRLPPHTRLPPVLSTLSLSPSHSRTSDPNPPAPAPGPSPLKLPHRITDVPGQQTLRVWKHVTLGLSKEGDGSSLTAVESSRMSARGKAPCPHGDHPSPPFSRTPHPRLQRHCPPCLNATLAAPPSQHCTIQPPTFLRCTGFSNSKAIALAQAPGHLFPRVLPELPNPPHPVLRPSRSPNCPWHLSRTESDDVTLRLETL